MPTLSTKEFQVKSIIRYTHSYDMSFVYDKTKKEGLHRHSYIFTTWRVLQRNPDTMVYEKN